jgi:Domain of unknown function (DUF6285)
MADRPDAAELIEAVREFIEAEVLPAVSDARLKFRVLVAANALTIAQRDLQIGDELLAEEVALLEKLSGSRASGTPRERSTALARELSRRIRRGDVPAGAAETLRRIADLKLRAASPAYLERRS